MKTTIYYFSGIGNSLKIAKEVSDKLEKSSRTYNFPINI